MSPVAFGSQETAKAGGRAHNPGQSICDLDAAQNMDHSESRQPDDHRWAGDLQPEKLEIAMQPTGDNPHCVFSGSRTLDILLGILLAFVLWLRDLVLKD